MTDGIDATPAAPDAPGSRRAALAALAATAALGLGSFGAATADAKGKKRNKKARSENNNGNGKNKGSGSNDSGSKKLPAVQYVVTENEIDATGEFTAFAECPDDYLPINGGIDADASTFSIVASTPNAANRRWEVEISDAVDGGTISVFAVCLEARDESPREARSERSGGRNRGNGKRRNGKGRGKKR